MLVAELATFGIIWPDMLPTKTPSLVYPSIYMLLSPLLLLLLLLNSPVVNIFPYWCCCCCCCWWEEKTCSWKGGCLWYCCGCSCPNDITPPLGRIGALKSRPKEMLGPLPLPGILPDEYGPDGIPVNCCTMARKLLVSVLSSVTGARLEARDLRLGDFPTRLASMLACEGGLLAGPVIPLPEVAVLTVGKSSIDDCCLIAAPGTIMPWLWL